MLLVVLSLKLVAEIALMALAGQWLLGLLAGRQRESNAVYRLLGVVTGPFVRVMRAMTPPVVLDRYVPLAAFAVLAMVWLGATLMKIELCLRIGVHGCR
jgi:ABC-type nitrate/sulfonate/bicarbonate transport system permease component